MGRSNYAILAMGLVSMLVLSTLMKYFLKATDEARESPIVQELMLAFGDRLDEPCQLAMVPDPQRGDGTRAVLSVSPSLLGISVQSLARAMGEFIWRGCPEDVMLTSVVVEIIPWQKQKEPQRIEVPRPYMSRPSPRPTSAPPKSAPAPAPPGKAPGKVPGKAPGKAPPAPAKRPGSAVEAPPSKPRRN